MIISERDPGTTFKRRHVPAKTRGIKASSPSDSDYPFCVDCLSECLTTSDCYFYEKAKSCRGISTASATYNSKQKLSFILICITFD
ncbi:hypothetical protein GCM10007096_11300 [Pullulanibacillus pueri]|uniref:Uncharacterized protein n=1 Tax=Pullulanibacillus pueri TaxID=1437324 RepID=A0A8J3ELX5_9BACL|nr:hypothetical protein GCM10007096_11300 [Pullulanibacillus pueri]